MTFPPIQNPEISALHRCKQPASAFSLFLRSKIHIDHASPLPESTSLIMAAAIAALNAKIRSQPVLNYVCSTRTFFLVPSSSSLSLSPRLLFPFWWRDETVLMLGRRNEQISGARYRISGFRLRRLWIRRRIQSCEWAFFGSSLSVLDERERVGAKKGILSETRHQNEKEERGSSNQCGCSRGARASGFSKIRIWLILLTMNG